MNDDDDDTVRITDAVARDVNWRRRLSLGTAAVDSGAKDAENGDAVMDTDAEVTWRRRLARRFLVASTSSSVDVSYTIRKPIAQGEDPTQAFNALADDLTSAVTGSELSSALSAELGVTLDPSAYHRPTYDSSTGEERLCPGSHLKTCVAIGTGFGILLVMCLCVYTCARVCTRVCACVAGHQASGPIDTIQSEVKSEVNS